MRSIPIGFSLLTGLLLVAIGGVSSVFSGGPPLHDLRSNARVITGLPAEYSDINQMSMGAATTSASDPLITCGEEQSPPSQYFHSVWYRVDTDPAGFKVDIDTHGDSYDTLVAVFLLRDNGSLKEKGCDDNDGGDNHSEVNMKLRGNRTYFIEVVSKFSDCVGCELDFVIND